MAAADYIWCDLEGASQVVDWLQERNFNEEADEIISAIKFFKNRSPTESLKYIYKSSELEVALESCEIPFVREELD